MTIGKRMELSVAYREKADAVAEIAYCASHPETITTFRRDAAAVGYANVCVKIDELRERV